MISGKLPNNTIWWLSTNGQKIWIESKDLEQAKFEEKGYYRSNDRIFHTQKEMGELATSRLESRKRKDAWIIRLDAMLDVYPELVEEIKRKDIEEKEKKKKRTNTQSRNKREIKKEFKTNPTIEYHKNDIVERNSIDPSIEERNNDPVEINGTEPVREEHKKEPSMDYFDINRPYVTQIKDEVDKSEKGEVIMMIKDLKSKMGEEFEKMDDFRIYFGLNKILPDIGIIVDLKSIRRSPTLPIEKMAVIKKKIINNVQQ